ncbi:manganese ABC transporter ATP-binding protein [Alkalispirochaeta sphaeroplastigenens]|uniref:Manganese ABC transporter ATP-binding protein n=1 Tax=Alkalispirochaeta sphaeroplastigenens TaxID=1187066 RepID=A0A2S4JF59_9SPIO|nr:MULTISPECIES: metal ABC transporter ATP-binding protein [Alkalispirochaeta]POQ98152.1 manganese ABC transporter ATP-binding protein [Alkalispirochaeta sphaeroplastigenens]
MTTEHAPSIPALAISDLTVAYHETPVLWDISLTVPAGSITGVVGPNGAGKSTLIKTIMGIVPPAGGEIRLFGGLSGKERRRVGYVPQRASVDWDFPATVLDVVLMGCYGRLGWFRRPRRGDLERAREALETLGITNLEHRPISELSGGQQQRTFLARALLQDADLYLMDEPFQGVDATTERAIAGVMRRMQGEGKTLVVVHHNLETVETYFDSLIMLNVRLIAQGPVAEVFTEQSLRATYGGGFP